LAFAPIFAGSRGPTAPKNAAIATWGPPVKNEAFLYQTSPRLFERHDYVRQYAPLVRRIAHQLIARLPANVELDDMIQAGMMGLMDAVSRFEVTQGTQFEVYAAQRIRGAMLDELRANDWLPRSARKSQRDIENAIHRLEGRLKRAPHESEIAAELGVSLADYQQLLHDARGSQLVYLDAFLPENGKAVKDYAPLNPTRDDGWRVPVPGMPPRFGVTDKDDVAWMEARLGDHPNKTFTDPAQLSVDKKTSLRLSFIQCTKAPFFSEAAERAMISVATPFSLRRTASSTAISSNGFIDILTLASSTPEPSALTRILMSLSTTRLTGTRIFMLELLFRAGFGPRNWCGAP
jgi:DNA-directed RNA polymerase specialized sigma24 family protein